MNQILSDQLIDSFIISSISSGNKFIDFIIIIIFLQIMKKIIDIEYIKSLYNDIKKIIINQNSVIIKYEIMKSSDGYNIKNDDDNKYLFNALIWKFNKLNLKNSKNIIKLQSITDYYYQENTDLYTTMKSKQILSIPQTKFMYEDIEITIKDSCGDEPSKISDKILKTTGYYIYLKHRNINYINDKLKKIYDEYIDFTYNDTKNQLSYFTIDPSLKFDLKKEDNDKVVKSNIKYLRYPFNSIKSIDKMFFPDKDKIIKKLDEFKNKISKYNKLTFLLYGPPGTGKTSFIKSIANYTNRSIINVKLSLIKNDNDLIDVFYNENIKVDDQTFVLPINKKIFVLEDIDAETNIVSDRSNNVNTVDDKTESKLVDSIVSKLLITDINSHNNKGITLSGLLNCLDGVLELNEGIVIITTNHPEKLDPALVREGRITMKINLNYMTSDDIYNMIKYYFPDCELSYDVIKKIPNNKYTPAKIENICMNNDSIDDIMNEIIN